MSNGNVLFFSVEHGEPGISVAVATGIAEASLLGFSTLRNRTKRDQTKAFEGFWDVDGSAAFVPATYNIFPVGSIVHDFIGFKLYYKTGATTWKYGAIAT
jgi:hypothetical protein